MSVHKAKSKLYQINFLNLYKGNAFLYINIIMKKKTAPWRTPSFSHSALLFRPYLVQALCIWDTHEPRDVSDVTRLMCASYIYFQEHVQIIFPRKYCRLFLTHGCRISFSKIHEDRIAQAHTYISIYTTHAHSCK